MQLDPQVFLRLVEKARTVGFVDIEATGLRGDYNSVICVSVRPFKSAPVSFAVVRPGVDRKVVRETRDALAALDCWVTYFGKGFDIPMLNTRLLRWGLPPIPKRPHIDLYYTLKSNILTSRRSQGHLLAWLDAPEQKMSVSAEVWNKVLADPETNVPLLVKRCDSDTAGLQELYLKTRHLVKEIKT